MFVRDIIDVVFLFVFKKRKGNAKTTESNAHYSLTASGEQKKSQAKQI